MSAQGIFDRGRWWLLALLVAAGLTLSLGSHAAEQFAAEQATPAIASGGQTSPGGGGG